MIGVITQEDLYQSHLARQNKTESEWAALPESAQDRYPIRVQYTWNSAKDGHIYTMYLGPHSKVAFQDAMRPFVTFLE